MDQLSDEKQKDEQWVEELALKEGMKRLNDREKMIIRKRFFQGKQNGSCRRNWDFSSTSVTFRNQLLNK